MSGEQRYRISYTVEGALNPFDTHDELYWNVTGNNWPVPIERSTATFQLPARGIQQVACYQGATGSTEGCSASARGRSATFASTSVLPSGGGLTFVLAIDKGVVTVGPPMLDQREESAGDTFTSLFSDDAISLSIAASLTVLVLLGLGRAWWLIGRDRWYGDTYYLADAPPPAADARRPLFAHQTVVVEYEPPPANGQKRHLRPAEIGLLLDERADTLDVNATIVDLAVRKHLLIKELPKDGVFGMFKSRDYELERLGSSEGDPLLPYEQRLLESLFEAKASVNLSDLKNEFHDDLQKVKNDLYADSVTRNRFFPADPEKVRSRYRLIGGAVVVVGAGIIWRLGSAFSAGVIGIPVVAGGVLLFLLARAMPCRTALGWHTYRRCLGFRTFMVTAETDRQKFAEEAHIFHDYLPYAIVYGCVEKWAKTFEALGVKPDAGGYYIGTRPFVAASFVDSMNGFSNSISGVMASTPGGSGGSGFGGGGSSGGGMGGGGGGSW